jgi:hypothetical protein
VPKDVLGEHLGGQIELEVVFVKRESGFDEKSEVEEKRSRAGENYIQASEGKSRAKTIIEVEAQWVAGKHNRRRENNSARATMKLKSER